MSLTYSHAKYAAQNAKTFRHCIQMKNADPSNVIHVFTFVYYSALPYRISTEIDIHPGFHIGKTQPVSRE